MCNIIIRANYLFTFLLFSFLFANNSFAQRVDSQLIGTWQVKTQSAKVQEGNVVVKSENERYARASKTFEFTADSQLLISENFGEKQELQPISYKGGYFLIGSQSKDKVFYLIRGNTLILTQEGEEDWIKGAGKEIKEWLLERMD